MKKVIILLLFCFIVVGMLGFIKSKKHVVSSQTRSASENYKLYCAGCHGVNFDDFIDRKWKYGNKPANVEQIIAKGIINEGMPAYEVSLTNNEIRVLSEYLLAESKSSSIRKSIHNMPGNSVYGTDFKYKAIEVVNNLEIPWGIEFLLNGDILIAEKNGTLSRFTKEKQLVKIKGLPEVRVTGQGGLMDLQLHPYYEKNGWLYISYSYIDDINRNEGNTAVIRGKLKDNQLTEIETIYKGIPAVPTNHHFGSRIEFDNDGFVYISNGDRGKRDIFPQSLDNSNGKVHRLNDDGSIPVDNPFYDIKDAVKTIFSYGHRNIQGIAKHPVTGEIWTHEHGPRGGDEINILIPGANYGWPVISYGINYNGTTFTNDTAKAGMEQPVTYYVPSIAPCGMAFVTSDRYGNWKNSLLIGSLRFQYLERCIIVDNKITGHERLLEGIGRVREVKMSPDGYIYVGVENPGRILKLVPINE